MNRIKITAEITIDTNERVDTVRTFAGDALTRTLRNVREDGVTLVGVTVANVEAVAAPADVTPRNDAERRAVAAALAAVRNG